MNKSIFKHRRYFFLLASMLFWAIFAYVWGSLGWNNAQLGTLWWYFDALGHIIAGGAIATNVFFLLRNYTSPTAVFRLFLTEKQQGFTVLVFTAAIAICWEFFEGALDLFRLLNVVGFIPAQTHALDTTADIFATVLGSIPAILLYVKVIHSIKDELLEERRLQLTMKAEMLATELRTHDKKIRKQILRKLQQKAKSSGLLRPDKNRG